MSLVEIRVRPVGRTQQHLLPVAHDKFRVRNLSRQVESHLEVVETFNGLRDCEVGVGDVRAKRVALFPIEANFAAALRRLPELVEQLCRQRVGFSLFFSTMSLSFR